MQRVFKCSLNLFLIFIISCREKTRLLRLKQQIHQIKRNLRTNLFLDTLTAEKMQSLLFCFGAPAASFVLTSHADPYTRAHIPHN